MSIQDLRGTTGNLVEGNWIGTDTSGGNLTTGRVAWYKAEGNANTISAGSNNGTLHGGVTFVPGEVGPGLRLHDGTTGYVDLGNGAGMNNNGSLSVSHGSTCSR